jgi:hypothetical protein
MFERKAYRDDKLIIHDQLKVSTVLAKIFDPVKINPPGVMHLRAIALHQRVGKLLKSGANKIFALIASISASAARFDARKKRPLGRAFFIGSNCFRFVVLRPAPSSFRYVDSGWEWPPLRYREAREFYPDQVASRGPPSL